MFPLFVAAGVSAEFLGVVDGWREYASPYGCYLVADYNNGTTVALNYLAKRASAPIPPNTMSVSLSNGGWTSLREGGQYPLTASFGRKTVAVVATYEGGSLSFDVDRRTVDDALFDKSYIEVSYGGSKLVSSGVNGVEAVYQVNMCLKRFNDPFRQP